MARQVRIEFEGAIYHVMARGNRRDRIFVSDDGKDEALFLDTLGEACARTGFEVLAYVLMGNHYHLVIRTPNANLVDGMSWLQNAYTRRFNARHKLWGRLFGDRYKAVLVEDSGSPAGAAPYVTTLLDYVHLNPFRAGLVTLKDGGSVLDYPFSSIAGGYALAPKKRPTWMRADVGLAQFGWKDTARERRLFLERLDERAAAEEAEKSGLTEFEGQTLHATLRRGWYWGSESFKEAMLERIESREKQGVGLPDGPSYRSDEQARDVREKRAERIIEEAVEHFGLADGTRMTFEALPRGELSRVAVAWAIWRKTSLSQQWIAERVGLKTRANVSRQVGLLQKRDPRKLPKLVKRWMRSQMG